MRYDPQLKEPGTSFERCTNKQITHSGFSGNPSPFGRQTLTTEIKSVSIPSLQVSHIINGGFRLGRWKESTSYITFKITLKDHQDGATLPLPGACHSFWCPNIELHEHYVMFRVQLVSALAIFAAALNLFCEYSLCIFVLCTMQKLKDK